MPQITKGGKFIYGWSRLREDGALRLPPQALEEYGMAREGRAYLFTGSRSTGGFCATRQGLLLPSKLGRILTDTPPLLHFSSVPGEFLRYKGRLYCWTFLSADGRMTLSDEMMRALGLAPGVRLLCIRSSDIAFTLGAKGPLLQRAARSGERIPEF